MATVTYPHIDYRADGKPIIAGTTTKVEEVVLDHIAYRWDAEQIHIQHPYLSLAQIHAALTYYFDHKEEIDRDIQEGLRRVDEIRASLGESPLRSKLKAMGHLP